MRLAGVDGQVLAIVIEAIPCVKVDGFCRQPEPEIAFPEGNHPPYPSVTGMPHGFPRMLSATNPAALGLIRKSSRRAANLQKSSRSEEIDHMTSGTKLLLLGAALSALMLPATAQTATPVKKPVIAQRKANQQARIAQGVKSGQLTAAETAHVEHQEARLNRETRAMRAANGGKLTPAEKAKVTRQQNHLSREIYRKKHNGRTQ
jgi:hypothetical protein